MKLKEYAEALSLTVAETAKKLGLTYSQVYSYMFLGVIPNDEETMKKFI